MKYHDKSGVLSVAATITEAERGGFTAVASTNSVDRDGEVIAPGALLPLPASIPVHLDHDMSARNAVARARPYYRDGRLMIDAVFGSDAAAQVVRQKVSEGLIDSVSIVFLGERWEDRKGVRTLTRGELLACDLVSVPSNRDARVLAARSLRWATSQVTADARAAALLALAEAEIADARRVLKSTPSGSTRRMVDQMIRNALRSP
jgi:HK97 family phage prohead protease